jgi:hypothetical protein
VVRTEADLVEANSKLGVIAGLTGFVAVIPAAILQLTPVAGWGTLLYSGALFGVALVSATQLPPDVVAARPEQPAERVQLHSIGVQLAAVAMMMLRAAVGFVFFHLAFWLREKTAGTAWFAVAVGMAALATMAGNAIAPRLRRAIREEAMLAGALALSTAAGLLAAFVGDVAGGVGLAVAVNFAAAIGRLGFESIVQRDAPQANRGRAFARFETRFQLAWAAAGLIPVIIEIPGWVGFLVVGLMCAVAVANYVAGIRSSTLRRARRRRPATPPGEPTRRPLPPPGT